MGPQSLSGAAPYKSGPSAPAIDGRDRPPQAKDDWMSGCLSQSYSLSQKFRESWSISAGGWNQTCNPGSVAVEGRWAVRVEPWRETYEGRCLDSIWLGFSVLVMRLGGSLTHPCPYYEGPLVAQSSSEHFCPFRQLCGWLSNGYAHVLIPGNCMLPSWQKGLCRRDDVKDL